ncbi:uncharacterized protein LOC126795587 [Argentina anserina]|uniref:uncharacterized protein LOC126795587 n=1 Tax=Argentina anserina TaxID=57926 RepID=UPI002176430B|nr:uncharacterized protein LOC126795587 [Potentilla anserina]
MQPHLFDQMMHGVANHNPYFVQMHDASGSVGFSTEQKLTCAMRILAYSLPEDLCDEFLDVAESSAMEILQHFTRAILNAYHKHYLRRPSPTNLRRLLRHADKRGFSVMVGSLDCMHWSWKNCPTSWQGHFTCHKRKQTIILEAVASYDTWIWHAYFGLPDSLNDINVLGMSPLFDDVCRGESPRVKNHVAAREYGQCYYLVDGIYPKWETFVKAIRNPITPQQAHFTKMQESFSKDVERVFGILQTRFAIVRGPDRGWAREDLSYIMITCIILHNMIVEDEGDKEEEVVIDPDDVPTRPMATEVYERYDHYHQVQREAHVLDEFMRRYQAVRCPVVHNYLRRIWLNIYGM